jgi:hypothetical protein
MLKWWEDITYPGKIDRFATSSWTTGTTAKYLPVTMEWLRKCHFKGSIDGLTFYIKNNPRSQFLNGKWLIRYYTKAVENWRSSINPERASVNSRESYFGCKKY